IVVGVTITESNTIGNSLLGNSIISNGGLGIDLGNDGVTPNQPLGTPGPNDLQTFPILTLAQESAGTLTVSGTFTTAANTGYTLQSFSSQFANPSGFGEGDKFLGSLDLPPDPIGGNGVFSMIFTTLPPLGNFITATATSMPSNDTSEFSN